MIRDISGLPLIILVIATIVDLILVAVAFRSFIKNK